MKQIIGLIALTFLAAISTTNAAKFSVRFLDDEVIVRSGNREYAAKASDPTELIRVGVYKEGKVDHYEEPLSAERDEGKVVRLEEVSPSTWLVPKERWWASLEMEWAKLQETVEVKPVDFPAVQLQRPYRLFVLVNSSEGYHLLRAVVGDHREAHRADAFAYPPPVGKSFRLGTFRGLLIPVIVSGDEEHAILPVKKE